jgi:hypothetical protein
MVSEEDFQLVSYLKSADGYEPLIYCGAVNELIAISSLPTAADSWLMEIM